mmetsp:Transcript_37516/g.52074  ORF Transcript_37516/g.52074 Transcript_37516/m.52074 type:complete len:88 (+) Transcript_37516:207-470(+)
MTPARLALFSQLDRKCAPTSEDPSSTQTASNPAIALYQAIRDEAARIEAVAAFKRKRLCNLIYAPKETVDSELKEEPRCAEQKNCDL